MVDAFELDVRTKLMHHYQESLVGGPPWFGDLENSAFGLVTISKLLFSFTCFYIDNFWDVFVLLFIILNAILLDMCYT